MTKFAEARDILDRAIGERVFPGAAFGVLAHGQVSVESIGRFTYGPRSKAVTNEALFDVASLTKVLATTMLAMRYWQGGRLKLQTPLAEVFPQFAGADPRRQQVTVKCLLAHTSGLPAHKRLWELPEVAAASSPQGAAEAALAACFAMPLERDPGDTAVYSDIGFILLGEVLRTLAGTESLYDAVAAELLLPLGADSTCFLPPHSWKPRIAPTCDWNWRHRVLQGEVHDENCALLGGVAGHAGLFSNCADILLFAQELISPGRVVDQRCVDEFSARVAGSRALGWDTPSAPSQAGSCFSARTIGHLGYSGTSLWIDLEKKVAVTLLTNRVYTGPEASPLSDPSAIQRVRPAFHDAVLRSIQAG
jgi:CubicO group peptidase (beta-lactamase class C family)